MNDFLMLSALLVLSGVFSGSETALVSLSMARAEALYNEGRRGAHALYILKTDPSRMLITILIGNNVVNIAASAMATVIATDLFGHTGPGIAVGVLTVLILIFGEITPKSIATRYSETISLIVAPLMVGFMRLIYPLVWTFLQLTNVIQASTRASEDPLVTESEVITMVGHGEEEGVIEKDEREMIERVFNFNDLKAEDVMTPRQQVFRLYAGRTLKDVLPEILKNTYSRIPLFEDDPDEIVGLVMLRELFEALAAGKLDMTIKEIAHEPLFTPANIQLDELILTLRGKSRHQAVVVDEHGTMIGVVSLEDLLEELVGEIYDESDEQPDELTEINDGRVLVDGTTELRVIEGYFGMELPGKPTDTANRWLLDHTERIPDVEERFELDGLEVVVQAGSSRRIHQLAIQKLQTEKKAS
ncbi:MAG: hypothetical protein OI74_09560 [Gammaproteobacteria bacterium (ex Lamellibrachia satsuma)]|nr:MAG: HlyC/CorC family transporter [Gammaproteobacteria bacterium (ex Lamellibrachia satsuma)]RRS33006.1 MAG: hypothetical protein OI74_09560 [Gammaproteobacteria bacterium (ex Lamellibrachia satsuma)]RRS36610.1 MAG: hypothetical protein NV67_05860 [Gammaproteobacteria bacterium (ex Lamellibrachia satsuma)]